MVELLITIANETDNTETNKPIYYREKVFSKPSVILADFTKANRVLNY